MSAEPIVEENEFANRDMKGLQPQQSSTPTEEAVDRNYQALLLVRLPLIGQAFAWSTYAVTAKYMGMQEMYDRKFALIHEFQLGYIYLAVWIMCMTRSVLLCNANGARAAARVDRPDQHVYRVMAKTGPLKDAPFVLMAGTGPQGRFNRAHRGVFNTDESLPSTLAHTVLAGLVFGPVVVFLAVLVGFGRVTFGKMYKAKGNTRMTGWLPAWIGEKLMEALTLLCAIKGIFFTAIPF